MSVDVRSRDQPGVLRGHLSALIDVLRPLARPAVAYLLSRGVALGAVTVGALARGEPGLLRALAIWDGAWYLSATAQGYPSYLQVLEGEVVQNNVAFFPLYPLAIRGLSGLTGLSPLTAAIAVASVAGLAAAVLLWVLVRALCDQEVAERAVLLFCFFPGSVVLSMAYSESLMLTLSIACLLALLQRRWLTAGVAGALATAS
ncbi:MAG: hypothetical protein M3276_03570 [Actinomycetota bacterium]|nr:hypothetical protein [Actinomycetota bacterium]